jgi:hypothetical protein
MSFGAIGRAARTTPETLDQLFWRAAAGVYR